MKLTHLERELKKARAYLKSHGIAATAKDSKLRYTNAAGQQTQPPEWIKRDEKPVIVLDETRKKAIGGER